MSDNVVTIVKSRKIKLALHLWRNEICQTIISGFHRAFLNSITFIGRLMHSIV